MIIVMFNVKVTSVRLYVNMVKKILSLKCFVHVMLVL